MSEGNERATWLRAGDRVVVTNPTTYYEGITGTVREPFTDDTGEVQYSVNLDWMTDRTYLNARFFPWEIDHIYP